MVLPKTYTFEQLSRLNMDELERIHQSLLDQKSDLLKQRHSKIAMILLEQENVQNLIKELNPPRPMVRAR